MHAAMSSIAVSRNVTVHKSLLRSPNMHRAHNVSEFEVINNDLADFKRKFMAVADFLMDNKADINAEGFAGISHGLFLIK